MFLFIFTQAFYYHNRSDSEMFSSINRHILSLLLAVRPKLHSGLSVILQVVF